MGHLVRRALVAALLTAPLAVVPAGADPPPTPEPTRVLLVGDSVTQGSAGDWTWRYRLAEALPADGSVDLVGPRDDLADNVGGTPGGSWDYADPDFDTDHAARWGMALSFPDVPMADLVEEHRPDVVVEARGINDLTFFGHSADRLLDDLEAEIEEARAVAPGVDIVVTQLPQVWYDDGTDGAVSAYNAALPGLAAELADPESDSEVVIAATGTGYTPFVDTWDQAHLAATGEVRFAAGVADALAELGIGAGYPTPWPEVSNGHWGAGALTATGGSTTAHLTWTSPPGASAAYVWGRDATLGHEWTRHDVPVFGGSWDAAWLTNGHTYEYRVQAVKGSIASDTFSPTVSVVPAAEPTPDPPGAPTALTAAPGERSLTVDWDAVPDADDYEVIWTSAQPGGSGSLVVDRPPVVLDGLEPGLSYEVSVTARNEGGPGQPGVVTGAPAGMPAPQPPTPQPPTPRLPGALGGLAVSTPDWHRLALTWRPDPAATSYEVGWRSEATGAGGRLVTLSAAASLSELTAGDTYAVTVTPLNAVGAGAAASARATPRGPRVAAPTRVRAVGYADSGRVRLTWRGRAEATSYAVWVRRSGWRELRSTRGTAVTLRGLGPGVHRLRVRPWHQRVPGAWSTVVRVRLR